MRIPFILSGEERLPAANADEAASICEAVAAQLESQGAETTLFDPPRITLKVAMPFIIGWRSDLAAPLDRIDLRLVTRGADYILEYRLSMVRLVAVATLTAGTLPFALAGLHFPGWIWFLLWGWPVLGSLGMTMFRAPRFFRSAVQALAAAPTAAPLPEPPDESARQISSPPVDRP